MKKPILDACCGSRMFWFDKQNKDVVGDFRNIPYKDNTFKLIVFDPPHLIKAGENSWLAKKS